MPISQVNRFQTMAPTKPPKMTAVVIFVSSTNPPEMVLATSVERNAPIRLRMAATVTAVFLGLSAPVAMEVAMALAVSWKPLVKSKTNAVMITTITRRERVTTCFLQRMFAAAVRSRVRALTLDRYDERNSLDW